MPGSMAGVAHSLMQKTGSASPAAAATSAPAGQSTYRRAMTGVAFASAALLMATGAWWWWRGQQHRSSSSSSGASASSSSGSSKSRADAADSTAVGLSSSTPTAQATAMMRFLCPKWVSSSPDIATESSEGEPFGEDEFAYYFLTETQRRQSKSPKFRPDAIKKISQMGPGLCLWLWTRTRVIDSMMEKILVGTAGPKAQQLVILGAGFDTRMYRFRRLLQDEGVRGFEVDKAELQATKRAAMKTIEQHEQRDIGLDAVTFVPLDLSLPTAEKLQAMVAAGYDPKLRTLFILEGVTAYLTQEAVQSTLQFMSDACDTDSTLLVTFLTPEEDKIETTSAMKSVLAAKGEPHVFYPQLITFELMLADAGWSMESLFDPARLAREYASPEEGEPRPGAHIALARKHA